VSDTREALPNPNPSGSDISPETSIPTDPASLAAHYEQDDVDERGILRFALAIAVGVALISLVLWIVIRYWVGEPLSYQVQIAPALVTPPPVSGPGLDPAPEVTLDTMLKHQYEWLNSYGWLDHKAGIVHIPIDQAMKQLVQGKPAARAGDVPDFRLEPAFRLDSSGGITPAGGQ